MSPFDDMVFRGAVAVVAAVAVATFPLALIVGIAAGDWTPFAGVMGGVGVLLVAIGVVWLWALHEYERERG